MTARVVWVIFQPVVGAVKTSNSMQGYFKAFLVVGEGDDEEEMYPLIVEDKPEDNASVQHFVAISGRPFKLKVQLQRPAPPGVKYGARVYVDTGVVGEFSVQELDEHTGQFQEQSYVFEENVDDDAKQIMKKAQEMEMDHFFWLRNDQVNYEISGFYGSGESEYQFVFGDLESTNIELDKLGGKEKMEVSKQLGTIRIQWSIVDHMKPRDDIGYQYQAPKQAAGDSGGLMDRKGVHLSTRPGKRLKTGAQTKDVAVLKKEIIYENLIHFNDFYGYQTSEKHNSRASDGPGRLRALPLSEFIHPEYGIADKKKRKKYIEKFLRWHQGGRYQAVSSSSSSSSNNSSSSGRDPNAFVETESLAWFITDTLSPATSYILCTGKAKDGNFGEKLVQNIKCSDLQRKAYFDDKENGLVEFFQSNPSGYELAERLGTELPANASLTRRYWKVRNAPICID